MPTPLEANIKEIRAYTLAHSDLHVCPYFLYDLHLEPSATERPIVVMGINPGYPKRAHGKIRFPTEETSLHDFHDFQDKPRSDLQWTKDVRFYCGTLNVVQTELFFWCTQKDQTLEEQFGPLRKSRHLSFCTKHNRDLIATHHPPLVICPGLKYADLICDLFLLKRQRTYSISGNRLVEHFTDGQRPWLVTKHWSRSSFLKKGEPENMRDYIQSVIKNIKPIGWVSAEGA